MGDKVVYWLAILAFFIGASYGSRFGLASSAGIAILSCILGGVIGIGAAAVVDRWLEFADRYPEDSIMRALVIVPLMTMIIAVTFGSLYVVAQNIRANWHERDRQQIGGEN